MGVGAGLYMCDVVKKSSRSLSHLLMSSCHSFGGICETASCPVRNLSSPRVGVSASCAVTVYMHALPASLS